MTNPRRPSGEGRWFGLLALVACAAVACSGSGFQYVKDSSSTAFFKIPDQWQLYGEDQILKGGGVVASPQAKEAFAQASWMVMFDAAPSPSLEHVLSVQADEPTGFAQVRPLGLEERDGFSISTIRNYLFDVDGNATDPSASQAELLSDEDVLLDGGYRGVHVEFNVQDGDEFLTVNQVGVVDPGTSTLYLFAIGCEARCYLDNQDTIQTIADSWTVEDRG